MPRPKAINHKIAISITLEERIIEGVKKIVEKRRIGSISEFINKTLEDRIKLEEKLDKVQEDMQKF